ncbi:hypothetical protein JAAARDRAFT_614057 [Jaapia argillacea MUCL 33604]|uniref:Protein kinase domain-containing protein n=1 Tax=Jaapia argillacea MUCL 33604 TaxID=933084 RepID=A0A067P820_9AGAM|nr:hypothetical protein JAAARDRAFT_614057 [Jaapia argillacea MUCL 33604]
MAPEILSKDDGLDGKATAASDVYAFAMLCWEVRSLPFNVYPSFVSLLTLDLYICVCVWFQLYARKAPFWNKATADIDQHVVKDKKRPYKLDSKNRSGERVMPDILWDVVQTCWNHWPEDRPWAVDVVQSLEGKLAVPVRSRRR